MFIIYGKLFSEAIYFINIFKFELSPNCVIKNITQPKIMKKNWCIKNHFTKTRFCQFRFHIKLFGFYFVLYGGEQKIIIKI